MEKRETTTCHGNKKWKTIYNQGGDARIVSRETVVDNDFDNYWKMAILAQ